jgi:uridine phosphorylase
MSRFGTCGGISDDAPAGKIVVATGGSGYVTRNPDAFLSYYTADAREAIASNHAITPYVMHVVAPSNSTLSTAVSTELISALGEECVKAGSNVTADSFYSSQGRIDDNFDDGNKDLIASILSSYPDAKTLEMETFMLLHLARCSKMPIAASAAAIVVANRRSADVIDAASLEMLEMEGGKAILKAICSFEI